MEKTPQDFINQASRVTVDVGRFIVSRLSGGAWAEFGDTYGEALGGYEPHPASIQFLSTDEAAAA